MDQFPIIQWLHRAKEEGTIMATGNGELMHECFPKH